VVEARERAARNRLLVTALLGVLLGGAAGVGGYTFVYARGASYLGNDPQTCANCHVMQGHLDAWQKGSHHAVATCNDCHAPHDVLGKYLVKGENGFRHSLAFTTQRFHEPLRIRDSNREVTEGACRSCHADVVTAMDGGGHAEPASCTSCHAGVGHWIR
jgi:cytochrome c nitrite reductase small subunit